MQARYYSSLWCAIRGVSAFLQVLIDGHSQYVAARKAGSKQIEAVEKVLKKSKRVLNFQWRPMLEKLRKEYRAVVKNQLKSGRETTVPELRGDSSLFEKFNKYMSLYYKEGSSVAPKLLMFPEKTVRVTISTANKRLDSDHDLQDDSDYNSNYDSVCAGEEVPLFRKRGKNTSTQKKTFGSKRGRLSKSVISNDDFLCTSGNEFTVFMHQIAANDVASTSTGAASERADVASTLQSLDVDMVLR